MGRPLEVLFSLRDGESWVTYRHVGSRLRLLHCLHIFLTVYYQYHMSRGVKKAEVKGLTKVNVWK